MKTPIVDFVKEYAVKNPTRLHMPGHKGFGNFGFEKYDVTEINGADSLFEAKGIIHHSEENAGSLFGCHTFYSTEGSSLCIRAMLYLVCAGEKKPLILAGRNAHKTFLTASALVDFEIGWLYPNENEGYLSCNLTAHDVENGIKNAPKKPVAVYLTSPDYLGNILDVETISRVCKKYGVYLLVDNAHGSYLKFLKSSLHPVDLGADMCCDSAHKTLPCLTGGAYLHISKNTDEYFSKNAKEALSAFASTSPSYLILQSLDMTNRYISEGFENNLSECVNKLKSLKRSLSEKGFDILENEPLKLTVKTKKYGYTAYEISKYLEDNNIFPEFADNDFLVLMFTPEIKDFEKIQNVFFSIEQKKELDLSFPTFHKPKKAVSVRDAFMSKKELIPVREAIGRVLSSPSVSCPPAVPIAVCGEVMDEETVKAFEYYGVEKIYVVK